MLKANRKAVPAPGGTVGLPDVTAAMGLLVVVGNFVVVVLTVAATVTTSGVGVTNLKQHNKVYTCIKYN
jgi:hypothetical protein